MSAVEVTLGIMHTDLDLRNGKTEGQEGKSLA